MEQNIFEGEIIPPQRPTFLKVLCILTFIGSGWGICSSAITYFRANEISKEVSEKMIMANDSTKLQTSKNKESVNFFTKVMKTASEVSIPENLRKSAAGNAIGYILCLTGAILMWRLRRPGFYLYVLGTIVGIAVPFYLFGNNFMAVFASAFASFIGLIFVIFYAMNLKVMK